MKRERLIIIDVLTGIAILLVLLGHHDFLIKETSWYETPRNLIYKFHMGLFMCLSGFLIRYTYNENIPYKQYVLRKIKKFVPTYFLVGILAALLKYTSLSNFAKDLTALVLNPFDGPIRIIWYIYVLLIFYIITPFVMRLSKNRMYILFLVSVIMSFNYNNIPGIFCMDNVFKLFVFYILGIFASDNYHNCIKKFSNTILLVLSLPFLLYSVVYIYVGKNPIDCYLLSGMISLPFMYLLARLILKQKLLKNVLCNISSIVFPIYLWQMFIINAGHIILNFIFKGKFSDYTGFIYLIISCVITILTIKWSCIIFNKLKYKFEIKNIF